MLCEVERTRESETLLEGFHNSLAWEVQEERDASGL